MGFVGNLAKKGAKKAGKAAVSKAKRKINGGCPGSDDGKHNFKAGKVGKVMVTYCRNPRCGRVH